MSTDHNDHSSPRKHVVLLIHGIRTQGEWQQRTGAVLETDQTIRVRPIRYGFLDIVRFLLPIASLRKRSIQRVATLLRDERTKKPNQLSIVAHSFGTYIVSRILEDEPDIELHRLILCGSIIPDGFQWEKFRHRLAPDETVEWQVVNDCGLRDPWPVLAQSITWGYGSSGRFGFGHPRVKDRFHPVNHSGFFAEEFVRTYWLPYLSRGEIIEGQLVRPTTALWLSLLTVLKLRLVIMSCLAALLLVGIISLKDQMSTKKEGQIHEAKASLAVKQSRAFIDGLNLNQIYEQAGLASLVLVNRTHGDKRRVNLAFYERETKELGAVIARMLRGVQRKEFDEGELLSDLCPIVKVYFPAMRMVYTESGVIVASDPTAEKLEQRCVRYNGLPVPALPSKIKRIEYEP